MNLQDILARHPGEFPKAERYNELELGWGKALKTLEGINVVTEVLEAWEEARKGPSWHVWDEMRERAEQAEAALAAMQGGRLGEEHRAAMTDELERLRNSFVVAVDSFWNDPLLKNATRFAMRAESYANALEAALAAKTEKCERKCGDCDSREGNSHYCLLWSINMPDDHYCKDWQPRKDES